MSRAMDPIRRRRPRPAPWMFRSAAFSGALLLALLVATRGTSASAHGVIVFGAVQGDRIVGEVCFQGGSPAADTTVTFLGPEGDRLGQVVTDKQGRFAFEPPYRCDYRLVVDAGMGHAAETTIAAADLPSTLPERRGRANATGEAASVEKHEAQGLTPVAEERHSHEHPHETSQTQADIEALERQITALRSDIAKWRAHRGLQDILGGVGYILGITGCAFYCLGKSRSRQVPEQPCPVTPRSDRNNS